MSNVPSIPANTLAKVQFATLGCMVESKTFTEFQECYVQNIGALLSTTLSTDSDTATKKFVGTSTKR